MKCSTKEKKMNWKRKVNENESPDIAKRGENKKKRKPGGNHLQGKGRGRSDGSLWEGKVHEVPKPHSKKNGTKKGRDHSRQKHDQRQVQVMKKERRWGLKWSIRGSSEKDCHIREGTGVCQQSFTLKKGKKTKRKKFV